MKGKLKFVLLAITAAGIFLTGCKGGNPGNSAEETASEAISETASETAAATVSETEEKIPEPQAAVLSAEKKGYEPYRIKLYDKAGTGMPRPDDFGEYEVSYSLGGYPKDVLSLMKDKAVAEKISAETEKLFELAEKEYPLYEEGVYELTDKICHTYCNAENGYLFYNICLDRMKNSHTIMSYSAVFDMRTGEKLELSDMFFEGEEFLPLLNKKLWEDIQRIFGEESYTERYNIDSHYIPVKREFAGLTEDGFYFDNHSFYIPVDNPYLASCAGLNVSLLDFDTVLDIPYDMRTLFEDGAEEKIIFSKRSNSNIIAAERYAYSRSYETGNIRVNLFDRSPLLTDEQEKFIEEQANNIIETKLDELNERLGWETYRGNDEPEYYDGVENENRKYLYYNNSYVINSGILRDKFIYIYMTRRYRPVKEKNYNLYFDPETLEPLDTEQIIERFCGGRDLQIDYVNLNVNNGDYEKWYGFLEENSPDISSIKPEDITLAYLSVYLNYHEKTEDYSVDWLLMPEQEEKQ